MKFKEMAFISIFLVSPAINYKTLDNIVSDDTLKQAIFSETEIQQKIQINKIWQEYLERKRKMPKRFQLKNASHPYFCCAFVQERLVEVYGLQFCKKAGIIGDGKRIGGTWNLLDNLKDKGYVIWEKKEKSSEIFKKIKKENPKLKYYEIIKRLKETNTREAENIITQGDIIFSWYPQSLFKKNYVTHACIVLGKKDNKWYVFQEWGHAVEILPLEKLYDRVPGGIDAVVRLNK